MMVTKKLIYEWRYRNPKWCFKASDLDSEILIYWMSCRSLHTVRPFRINFCYRVIMISILLQKCIPSYHLWNVFRINSFISEAKV